MALAKLNANIANPTVRTGLIIQPPWLIKLTHSREESSLTRPAQSHVRFGSKADMCAAKRHVCFTPNSDRESDFRKRSCLLYPRKQTCAVQLAMSALGHKRTLCLSFDHLVGALLKMKRHVKSQRLGGLDIN